MILHYLRCMVSHQTSTTLAGTHLAMVFALSLATPTSLYTSTRLPSKNSFLQVQFPRNQVAHNVRCYSVSPKTSHEKIVRRSANFQPSIWSNDYIQSLHSKYGGDKYKEQAMKLKEDVKVMLDKVLDPLDGLQMVDDLQRLGVSYHFENEIKRVLDNIYNNSDKMDTDLHATALKFRLLRQHGYNVPQEVFENFRDEAGDFKACLYEDIKGMLSLYEASFFLVESESILEEARDFTTKHLKQILKRTDIDQYLALLVSHALEIPLHWRAQRVEARWFIDVYHKRPDANPTLLYLAKLDYNILQALHLEDLKHVSRWWKRTGLGEKLGFARDRVMECFFWTIGIEFTPETSYLRRIFAAINVFVTTIDDMYDVYGTLDELELFTKAVERWDISAIEQLPDYMKICYLSLFNSINEMGYETLKEKGVNSIPLLHKTWAEFCKSYLVEAKWFYSGYTPTFEEYLNNAYVSISCCMTLTHAYFACPKPITTEELECIEKGPNILKWSATILRLADDLGTESAEIKRGDNPKSVQCYMHETNASEEDAREHVNYWIGETWKKINKDRVDSPFSRTFIELSINFGRMAQYMYQYADGHTDQDQETIKRIFTLLINPIPIT